MGMKGRYNVFRLQWGYVLVLVVLFAGMLGALLSGRAASQMTMTAVEDTVDLPIIMYHHLSENSNKLGDYTVSPTQLQADLKEISKRGYTPITVEQLCGYYEGKNDLPQKPILLTFDDGYYSVYVYAYPLLKQYNMPAACFVLGYYAQMYSDGEKQNIAYAHMTWEQLKEMEDSGLVTVGSHTYNLHTPRGQGTRYGISINAGESEEAYCAAVAEDLRTLSDAMVQYLGHTPTVFAYPFGAICAESYPLLQEMDIKIAFTCEEKVNRLQAAQEVSYPIRLGRYNRAFKYGTEAFFDRLEQ